MTGSGHTITLTPTACRLLRQLERCGAQTSRQLAGDARNEASITRVLRRLERDGAVTSEAIEPGWHGERRYRLVPGATGYRES